MKNIKFIIWCFLSICFCLSYGQKPLGKNLYFIEFTDKNGSAFSIEKPSEFLSQRAIERRIKSKIGIDESDLPVVESYINSIRNTGAEIRCALKWFNGIIIFTEDLNIIKQISGLDFVKNKMDTDTSNEKSLNGFHFNKFPDINNYKSENSLTNYDDKYYGFSDFYIRQINCNALHEKGYLGQGIIIGVLDAGFSNVNRHPVFTELFNNEQILGWKDFVEPNNKDIYINTDSHGSSVLSAMGGNSEGLLVGTAPNASYWLIRTEDNRNLDDYLAEEYFWCAGAEFADSVGVDIINSSLGYPTLHSYNDMNGETALITCAADKAFAKGILVVNAAGNEGSGFINNHIAAPADGKNVLTVGGVTNKNVSWGSSSKGPSYDGRIKPDISALSANVPVPNTLGNTLTYVSGTSLASPIIAGAAASLWSSNLNLTNKDIFKAIIESGSQFNNPDNLIGCGIANMEKALESVLSSDFKPEFNNIIKLFPNPCSDRLNMISNSMKELIVYIYDMNGRCMMMKQFDGDFNGLYNLDSMITGLGKGLYSIRVIDGNNVYCDKFIKQ